MPNTRVYLDYNASAPLRPDALAAMTAALALPGNPSSIHAEGRAARAVVEGARREVAALARADPRGVVFTSGATEAANLVLAPSPTAGYLLVGATEHPCVISGHGFGAAHEIVPVDSSGSIDLTALAAAVEAHRKAGLMLALQAANGETGVVQPVAEAGALVRAAGGFVVCDAVQAAGRAPVDMSSLGADALILSAHKIGGPKGAGALVFADPDRHAAPLIRGGGQERGARAGTENVPAIAGFGAAARAVRAAWKAESETNAALRGHLEAGLRKLAPDLVIFGADAPRLTNTSAFAAPGTSAQTLLMALDLGGFAVSSGSACSSGKIGRSHVLEAMGISTNISGGAIRVSLGWGSLESDIDSFLSCFAFSLERIRRGGQAA